MVIKCVIFVSFNSPLNNRTRKWKAFLFFFLFLIRFFCSKIYLSCNMIGCCCFFFVKSFGLSSSFTFADLIVKLNQIFIGSGIKRKMMVLPILLTNTLDNRSNLPFFTLLLLLLLFSFKSASLNKSRLNFYILCYRWNGLLNNVYNTYFSIYMWQLRDYDSVIETVWITKKQPFQ